MYQGVLDAKVSSVWESQLSVLRGKKHGKVIVLMEEMRRSPVEVGSLSTIILRVLYIPGG